MASANRSEKEISRSSFRIAALIILAITSTTESHAARHPAAITVCIEEQTEIPCLNAPSVNEITKTISQLSSKAPPSKDIKILLNIPPGRHELSETLSFGTGQQWSNIRSLTIRGAKDSTITGAARLTPSKGLRDFAIQQEGPLWQQSFSVYPIPPDAISPVRTARGYRYNGSRADYFVYSLNGDLRQAQWPTTGPTSWDDIAHRTFPQGGSQFPIPDELAKLLTQKNDLDNSYIHGYWANDWADERLPIAGSDIEGRLLTTLNPRKHHALTKGYRFEIINTAHGLRDKNTWTVNVKHKYILCNCSEEQALSIYISRLDVLVRMTGRLNVKLQDIAFEGSRGTAIEKMGQGTLEISGVKVQHTGGKGLDLRGGSSRLNDLDVRDTGEDGIFIESGRKNPYEPSLSAVTNSQIARPGRIVSTYTPAVRINGAGILIANNNLNDGPHSAIIYDGIDHTIVGNYITDFTRTTSDSGYIYTSMDWTAHGNFIAWNVLTVNGPFSQLRGTRKGIYIDDQSSGNIIAYNTLVGIPNAIFIGGGSDNSVVGNILVRANPSIVVDARGLSWQRDLTTQPNGTLRARYRDASLGEPSLFDRYPKITDYQLNFGNPIRNYLALNIFLDSLPPWIEPSAQKATTVENTQSDATRDPCHRSRLGPVTVDGRLSRDQYQLALSRYRNAISRIAPTAQSQVGYGDCKP